LNVLKEQYGLSAAPADTLQLATTPVVGSEPTANNIDSHPVNMLIKDVFTDVVGSGSESEKAPASNSEKLVWTSPASHVATDDTPKRKLWNKPTPNR
jgi:hypothetical protein